jgi:hypothetical protein
MALMQVRSSVIVKRRSDVQVLCHGGSVAVESEGGQPSSRRIDAVYSRRNAYRPLYAEIV